MEGEHPRCRFIARYTWLKEKLGIEEERLPQADCRQYREFISTISPRFSALVFPTSYMNRPASMFGHTFIRIDGGYESKLLSYAVNYTAHTGTEGGFLYALKGVFGHFKGYYLLLPYYEKVKEYTDMDHRDMWEYNLNLTEEELLRMLRHIWELKEIYSYYYFFDENCSYNILFLLEAGRPSVNLTDPSTLWVIPLDTVRAVIENGMVSSVDYRPSKATIIRHIASLLPAEDIETSLEITDEKRSPESLLKDENLKAKAEVLDLSAEMLELRYLKKKLSEEEYTKRFHRALGVRSLLKEGSEHYKVSQPIMPHKGHGSARLSIGAGIKNKRFFGELKLRPAYHDLLDPSHGYPEGSQIVFADIRARYYDEDDSYKLESIDFVNIVSISPKSRLFKPVSWKVKTGLLRKPHSDGKDHLVYYINGGYGIASEGRLPGLYYAFLEAEGNLGGKLTEDHSLGLGISAGTLEKITGIWKLHIMLKAMRYILGDEHEELGGTVAQNLRLSNSMSLTLELSKIKAYGRYTNTAIAGLNLYF
ncbi:MAG: DUF4105 domain-containing protein [Nitrospirae bacterium]|nr:DUF4105 domain-containing protein [Nitrospirota bacterium]